MFNRILKKEKPKKQVFTIETSKGNYTGNILSQASQSPQNNNDPQQEKASQSDSDSEYDSSGSDEESVKSNNSATAQKSKHENSQKENSDSEDEDSLIDSSDSEAEEILETKQTIAYQYQFPKKGLIAENDKFIFEGSHELNIILETIHFLGEINKFYPTLFRPDVQAFNSLEKALLESTFLIMKQKNNTQETEDNVSELNYIHPPTSEEVEDRDIQIPPIHKEYSDKTVEQNVSLIAVELFQDYKALRQELDQEKLRRRETQEKLELKMEEISKLSQKLKFSEEINSQSKKEIETIEKMKISLNKRLNFVEKDFHEKMSMNEYEIFKLQKDLKKIKFEKKQYISQLEEAKRQIEEIMAQKNEIHLELQKLMKKEKQHKKRIQEEKKIEEINLFFIFKNQKIGECIMNFMNGNDLIQLPKLNKEFKQRFSSEANMWKNLFTKHIKVSKKKLSEAKSELKILKSQDPLKRFSDSFNLTQDKFLNNLLEKLDDTVEKAILNSKSFIYNSDIFGNPQILKAIKEARDQLHPKKQITYQITTSTQEKEEEKAKEKGKGLFKGISSFSSKFFKKGAQNKGVQPSEPILEKQQAITQKESDESVKKIQSPENEPRKKSFDEEKYSQSGKDEKSEPKEDIVEYSQEAKALQEASKQLKIEKDSQGKYKKGESLVLGNLNVNYFEYPKLSLLKFSSIIHQETELTTQILLQTLNKSSINICTTQKNMNEWLSALQSAFSELYISLTKFHQEAIEMEKLKDFLVSQVGHLKETISQYQNEREDLVLSSKAEKQVKQHLVQRLHNLEKENFHNCAELIRYKKESSTIFQELNELKEFKANVKSEYEKQKRILVKEIKSLRRNLEMSKNENSVYSQSFKDLEIFFQQVGGKKLFQKNDE